MGRLVLGLHPVESALIDLDIAFQTEGLHLVHIALPGRIVVHVQLALDELGAVNIVRGLSSSLSSVVKLNFQVI